MRRRERPIAEPGPVSFPIHDIEDSIAKMQRGDVLRSVVKL